MPTVSAIIPTYNREKMVVEAIQSALQQTCPPNEIIVVDDGSTDKTELVIKQYDAKVRYIRQENSGQAVARNHGIQEATSDFIAFLDSDDIWVRNRLERQFAALCLHPDLDVIFGAEAKFTEFKQINQPEMKVQNVLERSNLVEGIVADPFKLLSGENVIPTSTVLFRKSCVKTVGPMDTSVEPAEDYDFWIRFALHDFRFSYINSVLCQRRLHEGNLVNQWTRLSVSTAEVLRQYLGHSPATSERIARRLSGIHYDLGSAFLKAGDWTNAYVHLDEARPFHQNDLKWQFKFAAASLLRRLLGKRTTSVA